MCTDLWLCVDSTMLLLRHHSIDHVRFLIIIIELISNSLLHFLICLISIIYNIGEVDDTL